MDSRTDGTTKGADEEGQERERTYTSGQSILECKTCCIPNEDLGIYVDELCGEHEHVCGLRKCTVVAGIEDED